MQETQKKKQKKKDEVKDTVYTAAPWLKETQQTLLTFSRRAYSFPLPLRVKGPKDAGHLDENALS